MLLTLWLTIALINAYCIEMNVWTCCFMPLLLHMYATFFICELVLLLMCVSRHSCGCKCGYYISRSSPWLPAGCYIPYVIWAMATDGLLFKFMAEISPCTKTPLTATLTSGVGAGETLTRMFHNSIHVQCRFFSCSWAELRQVANGLSIADCILNETCQKSALQHEKCIFNCRYSGLSCTGLSVVGWGGSGYTFYYLFL